jgi:hypothetical protein
MVNIEPDQSPWFPNFSQSARTIRRAFKRASESRPCSALHKRPQAAGKNRATILRAIKSGHLSATRDAFGRYEIQEAELARAPANAALVRLAEHRGGDKASGAVSQQGGRSDGRLGFLQFLKRSYPVFT